MKTYKYIIMIIILMINIININAKEIKGTIYGIDPENKKILLSGASIAVLGTNNGVIADKYGKFTIYINDNLSKKTQLIASFVGFKKDTISLINNSDNIEIILKNDLVLGEINVYESKPATLISSDIAKTEIITNKGLLKAACCSLGESFVTNPSVDVEYTDALSGAKQIKLLGLAGIYSQILTEKIPNYRGIASIFGLNYIPGPWMESIQISKGASSVTTGFESISGQINVEYKKAKAGDPLYINLYADDMGAYEGNVISSLNINDKLNTALFIHGNISQEKMDVNNDSFLDQPLVKQINLMNRWEYDTDFWHSRTFIKALYEDRKSGQVNYFANEIPTFYGIKIKTQRYEFSTKNGFVFPTEYYQSLGTMLSASYHKENAMFGLRDYDGEQTSAYGNLIYQINFYKDDGGHNDSLNSKSNIHNTLILGTNWQYDKYNEKFQDSSIDKIESIPGVYSEWTLTGLSGFTFITGLRSDFHNKFGTFITPRLHIRYEINPTTTLRASAGKGFRTTNIFAENTSLMASSRQFVVLEELKPEKAWNYGINGTSVLEMLGLTWTANAEFYRTDFINQIIVNIDKNPGYVYFSNLNGKSYSNCFQFDLTFSPIRRLDIMTAYRFTDVQMTIDNNLEEKPLTVKHKAFVNFGYSTELDEWQFDFTFDYNGQARLPNTSKNPVEYRLADKSPDFVMLYAQVTKNFDGWSIYAGVENLTNYTQKNPILSSNDPFGKYFDSSIIWGPLIGRKIYIGIRLIPF